MSKTILIVDDENVMRAALGALLAGDGYGVLEAENAEKGFELFRERSPDLVLLDVRMPGEDGVSLLKRIKAIDPAVMVMMVTAVKEVETAVEAMKSGAYDYVTKPFDFDKISVTIRNALEAQQMRGELSYFREKAHGQGDVRNFVGQSDCMKEIFAKITKIGKSKANTILITGESGVGKELVARTIHASSHEAPRPFMEINCASVPETLLESELFGYEKGAFTDAKTRKKGLVELAEGGTLFLDEIGEMGVTLQSRLLRVIENKTFRRVGGVQDLRVNTRIVAATNRDLEKAIEEKSFRKDLYYRLKVIPIHVPPLRERREDVVPLVNYFVDRFNRELGKKVKPVSREVLEALVAYDWPGNVRELKNVVERAMLLDAEDEILLDHLPSEIYRTGVLPVVGEEAARVVTSFMPMTLRDMERVQIKRTLEQTNGNKSRAATILGISRQTLREKLKQLEAGGGPEA